MFPGPSTCLPTSPMASGAWGISDPTALQWLPRSEALRWSQTSAFSATSQWIAFSIVFGRFPGPRQSCISGQRHRPVHTQGSVFGICKCTGSRGLGKCIWSHDNALSCDHIGFLTLNILWFPWFSLIFIDLTHFLWSKVCHFGHFKNFHHFDLGFCNVFSTFPKSLVLPMNYDRFFDEIPWFPIILTHFRDKVCLFAFSCFRVSPTTFCQSRDSAAAFLFLVICMDFQCFTAW